MSDLRADRDGVWVPSDVVGSCAAVFDGRVVWRFDVPPTDGHSDETFVPWPASMRPWLNGVTVLEVHCRGEVYGGDEIHFGDRTDRVQFLDESGTPIVIDKWGLVQTTFGDRGSAVVEHLADRAAEIVELLDREMGIELWMGFGTLLGAVRGGKAIPDDSDLDFVYLSDQPTPARMVRELYDIRRVLVRHGYWVVNKTGGFITVMVEAPDGSPASIDIYTAFHLSGLYHAYATVRTELPRDAILPLGTAEFEGRQLPVPADPDRVLAASYGPGWRTPDPGFRHEPADEVVARFDGWFGSLMRQRRDWEIYWRDNWSRDDDPPGDFIAWVRRGLTGPSTIVDLGSGISQLALVMAAEGHEAWAVDYARDAVRRVIDRARWRKVEVQTRRANFYDTRDALTLAAVIAAETRPPRVLTARHLVDAMPGYAREEMWRVAALLTRGGGKLYLEFDDLPEEPWGAMNRFYVRGGRQWPITPTRAEEEWTRAGLVAVHRERRETPRGQAERARWRMVLVCAGD